LLDLTPIDFFEGTQRTRCTTHKSFVRFEKCIVHSVEGLVPQMYGIAFRAFEYQLDIVQAAKGVQVKVQ
jgi:hypothetical protein